LYFTALDSFTAIFEYTFCEGRASGEGVRSREALIMNNGIKAYRQVPCYKGTAISSHETHIKQR